MAKVLLVEGTDDEHVFKHLFGQRGLPHLDEIKPLGSVEKLLEHFPVRLKPSEPGEIVGVVVDADTDLEARWHSLRQHLLRLNYPNLPTTPDPAGTVLDPPDDTLHPRVGIWIMPENRTTGILENFLRFLVPQDSQLFDHVKTSVATIPPDEKRFAAKDDPKALIHTWLAWQEKPGRPLGTAISAGFLKHNVPQVDDLVAWLNRLYFQLPTQ